VVENGVPAGLRRSPGQAIEAFRRQSGWPREYLLFLGVLERRKNLGLLLECLARLDPEDAPPLVIAGRGGPEERTLRRRAGKLGLGARVHFSGYVPDEWLAAACSGAAALLMPSRYEGFGLPVLEAFACGTPVVAANAGALREVASDAALLREPDDVEGWCDAIRTAVGDSEARERLARRGRERAAERTWRRSAERMRKLLESLA
jgi:alpha-1,3-rhamnosyl/mannosyltransferase